MVSGITGQVFHLAGSGPGIRGTEVDINVCTAVGAGVIGENLFGFGVGVGSGAEVGISNW